MRKVKNSEKKPLKNDKEADAMDDSSSQERTQASPATFSDKKNKERDVGNPAKTMDGSASNEQNKGPEKTDKKVENLLVRNSELEKELEISQKKLVEGEDFILRLRADFDNFRKRAVEERDRLFANAGEAIFKDFLKIYDSYTKALDVEITEESTQAFLEGFRLIKNEMDKFLSQYKVAVSTQVGDEFDPNIHQAIFFEETDKVSKEKVMEIFQHGYLMNDRLLREAMVKVEKPKANDSTSPILDPDDEERGPDQEGE